MYMTFNEAMNEFIAYAKQYDRTAPNKSWYVGITTQEPDTRKTQHQNEKDIVCKHFKVLVTGPEDVARSLEKALEKKGFAIGEEELDPITESASSMKGTSFSNKMNKSVEYSVYIYLAVDK
jgi:predicted GIY-YIG superfamily endonuclease